MLHQFQLTKLGLRSFYLVTFIVGLISLPALGQSGGFLLKDWAVTSPETKAVYTRVMMEQASVHKVRFKKAADFYQAELDNLARFSQAQGYEQFLQVPAAQGLAIIAIVNCDWDNGIEPYGFALKHLGKEKLALLKGLYADAIIRLENHCQ